MVRKPVYKDVGMPCQEGGKQGRLWCGSKDQHAQIFHIQTSFFTLQSFIINQHMIVRVTQWSGIFPAITTTARCFKAVV